MIDHNLRTADSPDTVAGPFDSESIMLYQFDPLFYKTTPSKCAPTGNGIDLSDGDRRGLQLLYPYSADEVTRSAERAARVLDQIGADSESDLETVESTGSSYWPRVIQLLNSHVSGDL